jgi:hypothetical protein
MTVLQGLSSDPGAGLTRGIAADIGRFFWFQALLATSA